MDPVKVSSARENQGLVGNADQQGKRQVTIIEKEVFDALSEELQSAIDPSWRRANVMVSGIRLEESRGRRLQIGDLTLEIEGETRPCERMDEAFPGLQKALQPKWRGGVYGVVLNNAEIQVGDPVSWAT